MIALFQDDCLEVMKDIKKESVDLVLTDLPQGTSKEHWDTLIPFNQLWDQYERIVKPSGAIVVFGKDIFASKLRLSNFKLYKYDWVWIKNTQTGMATANIKPMDKHESIMVFYQYQPKFNKQMAETESESVKKHAKKGYIQVKKGKPDDQGQWRTTINPSTVLKFNVVSAKAKDRLHPRQKPVDLLEYLIKTYTDEGDTVLDSCMGSGSVGIACENTKRHFIGIEKDEKFYHIAQRRIYGLD